MYRYLVLCSVFIFYSVAHANEVYFSTTHLLQKQINSSLQNTHQTIDLAMYELTDPLLIRTLAAQVNRGVHLRLILDHSRYQPARYKKLFHANCEVRVLMGRGKRRGLMHHKFAVLDSQKVFTGSANWTAGASFSNYENVLLVDDLTLVTAYQQEFNRMWAKARKMSLQK